MVRTVSQLPEGKSVGEIPRSPSVWSPRPEGKRLPGKTKDGRKRRISRPCKAGFHTAKGYSSIKNPREWCAKDCYDWNPPRVRDEQGKCSRPKTEWMKGLLNFYHIRHKANPRYKFSEAMIEYRVQYNKEKARLQK